MSNKIDVYDSANQPTGQRADIDSVLRKGQWHRGVHIVVYTQSGYVLVQKRSSNMLMHPGYLDISCGGFVDAGETPEHAALRETKEELGLLLKTSDLQLLSIKPKNHAWPSLHKHDRTFEYYYAVCLPTHTIDVSHLQTAEVEWAGFISYRKAWRLLRLHHLKGLGRIEPHYKTYRYLLKTSRHLQTTKK